MTETTQRVADFFRKHFTMALVDEFKALAPDERRRVLEELGDVKSCCGKLDAEGDCSFCDPYANMGEDT
jgi:hypothetical protein